MRLLVWLCAAALVGGCATFEVVDKGEVTGPDKSYTVQLPLNWMRLTSATQQIVVTRDGFGLQYVALRRVAAKDAFAKVKKSADEKMLPSELADLQVAELKSANEQLANLVVKENAPSTVGGKGGFRLHVEFKNERGLDFDQVHYAVLYKGYYYLLSFQAPRLYYFAKYLPDFERTAASFKLA